MYSTVKVAKRSKLGQMGFLTSLGSLPDSPPDSGSEHLLSPANSNGRPPQQQQQQQQQPHHLHPLASSSNSPVHSQGGNSNNNNNFFQEHLTYQTAAIPLTTTSPPYSQQQQQQQQQQPGASSFVGHHLHHLYRPFPDLSTIDYSVPLQLIEQHQRQQSSLQTLVRINHDQAFLFLY